MIFDAIAALVYAEVLIITDNEEGNQRTDNMGRVEIPRFGIASGLGSKTLLKINQPSKVLTLKLDPQRVESVMAIQRSIQNSERIRSGVG